MTAERIRERYQFIYLLFQELLLLGICLFGLGSRIGIAAPFGAPLAAGVTAVLLFTWVCSLRRRERAFAFAALACGILAAVPAAGESGAAFFASYRSWLVGGEAWIPEWQTGYEVMQAILAAAVCCFVGRLICRFFAVRAGLAVLLSVSLLTALFGRWQISHAGTVLSLWYGVMTLAEYVRLHWEKKKEADAALYTVWLMPVGLVLLALMLLMPSPQEAYDWAFVKEAYGRIRESVVSRMHDLVGGGREDFGVSFQGLSEDGDLRGGLRRGSRALFQIESDSGFLTNLYLAGASYDRFDGRGWEKTCHEEEPWRIWDTLETVGAVQASAQNPSDYLKYTQLHISYGWFRTGYLFAPLKTRRIRDCEYENDGGDLRFGSGRGYGTSYQADYYQINAGTAGFYELMERLASEPRTEIGGTQDDAPDPGELARYRNSIRETYGEGTALSPGVQDWLERVLEGAETDAEKLRALEYVLSSLEYTRTPGELPEKVKDAGSFLDYFLLESGRGYCSYFATAFVLLARSQGIPARYVEGFCVPARQKKSVTVTSDMTHAWPEVWLEGFGWLPFEPTPGFLEVRYTPWRMSGGESESAFAAPDVRLPARPAEQNGDPEQAGMEEAGDETADGGESEGQGELLKRVLRSVLAGLAALFCCFPAVLWVDRALRSRRFSRMEAEEKFLYLLRQELWLLSRLGLTRGETETLQEFRVRCDNALGTKLAEALAFYEEVLYADRPVPEQAAETAAQERQLLLSRLRENGRLQYWLARFRLGG